MFESIIYRSQSNTNLSALVDTGALFETMIFYGSTNLFCDRGLLELLIRKVGLEVVIALIEEGFVVPYFVETIGMIKAVKFADGHPGYQPDYASFAKEHPFYPSLTYTCIDATGKEGRGRRVARRIASSLKILRKLCTGVVTSAS